MQSLQTGNVRDLSSFLEGGNPFGAPIKSPEKIATRPTTPSFNKEFALEDKSPERGESRSVTPTPSSRDKEPESPALHVRPSLRRPQKSIIGENNSPQSATMLALHSMPSRDFETPLHMTNGSTAIMRTPQTFDAISNQILSLTSIATGLQREMAQLSRRSKDNATDLVSLKEATNSRDEDIRKSLRELVSNLASEANSRASSYMHNSGSYLLDNKAYLSQSPGNRSVKTISLPRIPSPNSFSASLDRESTASPSVYNSDGGAVSIALLEKILRDMGTKEGQDSLVSRLTEVAEGLAREGMATSKKLEDLVQFIKDNNNSQALITRGDNGNGTTRGRKFSFDQGPNLELDYDRRRSGPMVSRVENLLGANKENQGSSRGADVVSDEILKIVRHVKDSVSQGGGLTAEVKALVRELRGEVLGMGREIGRKLEAGTNSESTDPEGIVRIVQESLEDLKHHMEEIMRENRRQSSSSAISRSNVDSQEIMTAVKNSLAEMQVAQAALVSTSSQNLDKDDVIQAVKEAWETYKPDIEVQHFGLERDELLVCLKEGIQEYLPGDEERTIGGASRDEVFTAVIEGLKHFSPPQVETEASLSRDEILDAVRECLEEFEFPAAPSAPAPEFELTREDMLEAVREGLNTFEFPTQESALSRDIVGGGLTRDDVFDAVKAVLEESPISPDGYGQQLTDRLQDVLESMQTEFRAVSDEAKQNVAAHGRDTEQLLDATKDGFEKLRTDIESYVDRAADITGKDEILDNMRESFDNLRAELDGIISKGPESSLDGVKDELEHLRETMANSMVQGGANADKDEIMDAMRETFDGLRADLEGIASRDSEGQLEAIRGEFEQLHETLATAVVPGGASMDKDEILNALNLSFEGLKSEMEELVSRNPDTSLDAIKGEFEQLRETMATSIIPSTGANVDKDEIMSAIRESMDSLRAELEGVVSRSPDGSLDAIKGEFENLRETMATAIVPGGASADKEEILVALREGLDELRADMDRPKDNNESVVSGTGEILDALHDGLTGLRTEVETLGNKPVDMTVSYEILDTLKTGLEGVRADIDRLRESGHGEKEVTVSDGAIIAAENLQRNDIENLEVLITQLKIKIEAMESMPPPVPEPVPGAVSKEDLAGVEEMIKTVLASVAEISSRETVLDEDRVRKEDIVAIENLLRNTKAQIDEMDPEQAVKKDHLDSVEILVRETHETINTINTQFEDAPKKEDVSAIELLVRDILTGLAELKEQADATGQDAEKVTKTDIEAVEAVCHDVKSQIEQMVLTDLAMVASKEDLINLGEMVKEFKGRIELHAETNATAFEERQAETVGVGERVSEIKTFLEEFKDAVKEKLEAGHTGVEALGTVLETLSETIGQNANVTTDIKELAESMKAEFEKSNAGVVGAKMKSDEKFQKTWDDLGGRIDEKFEALITKYDDAQVAAEAKIAAGEEKNAETEAALLSTKAVADELKLLVDTLGTTLVDSVDKMDESSKTVFNRVEDTFNRVENTFTRVEETHADAKAEHQLTREQVFQAVAAIEAVQGTVKEQHPEMLGSIKDVLLLVEQHYEHSKTAAASLEEKTASLAEQIAAQPPPVEVPMIQDVPVVEKYDDAPVQEKLDQLVEHMQMAGKSFAQLDMLDKIHQQVMQTAAEVADFVSTQTKLITEGHDDQARAVEAATIALEKRLTEKEQIEAGVAGLQDEEAALRASVAALRAEQDSLGQQKTRLTSDVSSLETALRIRREELHAMEARAEGLERRILEGVIDHSRALLVSRPTRTRDQMNLKRVPSHAGSATGSAYSSARSRAADTTLSAVSMAMSGNRGLVSNPITNTAGASRRILSLNQITHNAPAGSKRSHSVKSPGAGAALRKTSWGGSLHRHYGELNKENLAMKESEDESDLSDTGTTRRTSRGLSTIGTESMIEEGTEYSEGETPMEEQENPVMLYAGDGELV